ncbi:DUF4381 domain-containing protein [Stenotrophomonas sp. ZAC14D2_NAIMI4_7]|uniref:DUF4381 family protein n=1 Tax=Stenotrophomonas sp. ZAC14D2_NAIMI4_7 TaxID=2072405 RepID=UPI000D53D9EC|nr:DUF4381 family protein [Stenotrophomonas sp. ZAC14D2_NAIMI4_7]AWH18993.1 DUF4381 domain-containing protein [Stenotrophomonas sp. ZAC14D2_NAIMI4_7]
MSAALPLRDVALPPAPSWWPPAPGWLMVMAAVLAVLAVIVVIVVRRHRRRQRWLHAFDTELRAAANAPAELAVIAGLLRRAARQAQPGSEALQDAAWWTRVDPHNALPDAQRTLLAEGPYRPQIEASQLDDVRAWARQRYVQLLQERRR